MVCVAIASLIPQTNPGIASLFSRNSYYYRNTLPIVHSNWIPVRMSGKLRGSNVKWDSSTEEDDAYDSKYKMKLRDTLRNTQQSSISGNETVLEPRKRGREPSRRPCLNRNALMARENRLKKKAYLEKIENKLSFYQQENKNLVNVIRKQGADIKRLSSEVAYLRSVLNNSTNIAVLLKTINDGLRKINARKKNSFYPNNASQCPAELDAQHKRTCCPTVKDNILSSQSTNIFVTNVNNDLSLEHGTTENQSNESLINERHINCKKSNIDRITSLLDSDHTYTVSKIPTVDTKNVPKNNEATNLITSTTSSISEDSYLDNSKELDSLLPIPPAELLNGDEKKDADNIAIDFDQLSTFNMDIFEDLPKCDEMMNIVEGLNDASNLFTEEEIFQSLDNTGICLHVNSDKLSLEFCSICHFNSKNLGLN